MMESSQGGSRPGKRRHATSHAHVHMRCSADYVDRWDSESRAGPPPTPASQGISCISIGSKSEPQFPEPWEKGMHVSDTCTPPMQFTREETSSAGAGSSVTDSLPVHPVCGAALPPGAVVVGLCWCSGPRVCGLSAVPALLTAPLG